MKLGTEFPQKWKDKSIQDEIPLSDLLYGYVIEHLMYSIHKSSFQEILWLANKDVLGEAAYKKTTKQRLEFLYIEKEKKTTPFSMEVVKSFAQEVLKEQDAGIEWEYTIREEEHRIVLLLIGSYMDMQVPVQVCISPMKYEKQIPKEQILQLLLDEKKVCQYFSYSRENVLSESVFEIMRKLELISDMKAYATVNEILKSQSVSGRRVLDELKKMGEKEPKVVSMKHLELISSYENYGYMKKKWLQYAKKHMENPEDWEIIMQRLLAFLAPLWRALCENEIFFDDWMPELERFLG